MNLEFLALYVVLLVCGMCRIPASANNCCRNLCSDGSSQNTGVFSISLSCSSATIHWVNTLDSSDYYLSLHETCYNVTTGEMLPDYPNCIIQGERSSGNKAVTNIGEYDDIVCSYGGCIIYYLDFCNINIPRIGNCSNPAQISDILEPSSLSYSSSVAVSLPPSLSPSLSSLPDIISYSSIVPYSSSIDDTKTVLASSLIKTISGTKESYDISTSFSSWFPSISSPKTKTVLTSSLITISLIKESYNISTSFSSWFPSISSPVVPSTTTLANSSLGLSYIFVSLAVAVLLCILILIVILLLLLTKKRLQSRSKLTAGLILMDGPRIELFFEDLKGFSLQTGSMETLYTPLESSYCNVRGHIDTRDKESVATATSSEDLDENNNGELEKGEEVGNELGGASDANTVVMSETSNQSSYMSSGSSGFGNDNSEQLQFHGLTQLNSGYVTPSGSMVESSGQSHGYVPINNGHMVATTNGSMVESSGYIQTTNESMKSNGCMEEESSGQYVQINTGHIQMNDGCPETNRSILSNGYIQTDRSMEFNGHMQSKSFITSDIKFENDYIPNNLM